MVFWERDFATGKTQWGDDAAEILGTDSLPDDGTLFAAEEDAPKLEQVIAVAFAQKQSQAKFDFAGRDGRWWRSEMIFERDPDGKPLRVIGINRDITEERQARLLLETSEARFRSIANAHPSLFFLTDVQGDNIFINDMYRSYTGHAGAEALGPNWQQLVHPDDLPLVLLRSREAAETGKPFEMDYRIRRHDGQWRWHSTRATQVTGNDLLESEWIGFSLDIEARREAEERLRQSEERYHTLFDSLDQGFCLFEMIGGEDGSPVDYRILEANRATTEESGVTDIVGKTLSEVMPDLAPIWFERHRRVALTNRSERFLDFIEPVDKWFEGFAFPVGQAEAPQIAVLFSDVSERLRQEEFLKNSEERYRVRLDAIPQIVWSTLPDGFHDFYNARWYEITGVREGSTDGEGWNGMFHPDDQKRAFALWQASLDSGEPYEIEYRLRHRSGDYRWVLGRALPVRDEQGVIQRWMGTCTDIADLKSAEEALSTSEARLKAVLESAPIGLVFADSDGKISGGNSRSVENLGQAVVQSRGVGDYRADYVAFHADGRQVDADEYPLARVIAGDKRSELECQVQRGDGSLAWVRYVAGPIIGADGGIDGGVGVSIDIDRERRLSEGLEREVERVIGEREAAQEALRQSQKLEAMGQLTGGVAHDFNNLLTPIIGSLDLLQRKQIGDERTRRLVDGALQSAERAKTLVQRLLAFARRQPLQPTAVDVGRIATDMAELIESTSGPQVRVEIVVDANVPMALADGNQLEMALLNLSVNARDAMPGGGRMRIAVECRTPDPEVLPLLPARDHIVLTVADDGSGMSEETLERAIEPFYSTKGVGKGTGLGLSMVHGLAAQLGGALRIDSALGKGTTIALWLPLSEENACEDAAARQPEVARGRGTVLLVDDEELVRGSTASMLADLGFNVAEADSAEDALRQVKQGLRPDLLVTDQLMPGASGTDLAVALRRKLPMLPVLVVSGYADAESLSPGFPHLSKPFRQADLAERLAALSGATG